MKFLIDAQLPRRLAADLKQAGFEATHTLELPEGNRTTDQALIKLSIASQSVLVTKDSDFVQSFLLKREPWKLDLPEVQVCALPQTRLVSNRRRVAEAVERQ